MSVYTFHSEIGTTISDDNNTEAASLSSRSSNHSSLKTTLAEANKQNDKLMEELNRLWLQAKQQDKHEADPSEDEKSSTPSQRKHVNSLPQDQQKSYRLDLTPRNPSWRSIKL